jgi:signal transduction histidine kinase
MRSLRRTLAYHLAALIVCLILLSAVAVWGIRGLRQDFSSALQGHEQLRTVYEVGAHVNTARTLISLGQNDRALAELQAAELIFARTQDLPMLHSQVDEAIAAVRSAGSGPVDPRPIQQALGSAVKATTHIGQSIRDTQKQADHKQRVTIIAVAGVAAFLVVGAIVIGTRQYRFVMQPLTTLGQGVRRVATGEFSHRLSLPPRLEFAALSDDFNHMAAQLEELYTRLEQQVAEKSRELVRSQRLASVGFLAAGVAHEINNPLGIITGFGEFTIERLKSNGGDPETIKALQAICDEAFRCKTITERLLSMARSSEAPRADVDLAAIAKDVIGLTTVLKPYQGRRVHFAGEAASVSANEAEMRQVILNLLTNALEAIDEHGEVRVSVKSNGKAVELTVKDTGRGMNSETLGKIFEPFFTLPRDGRRGTGLGLSIAHAIVESHGGSIRATSEGEGKGSEFLVTLPA